MFALMLTAALSGASAQGPLPPIAPPDPVASALARYHSVESYRVDIRSFHHDMEEHILYFYKKPGYVRMEFIRPHPGALLVYDPDTRRVRLWPFGFGHFPELNLSPSNPLIKGAGGERADRSDVGALLENIRALQQGGSTQIVGQEQIGGRALLHLVTTGGGSFSVSGVHRYELWLDAASEFPAKVVSRDASDAVMETVLMDAPEINATLPPALFNP